EPAERVVRRALELDPEYTGAWHSMAWLRLAQGRIDEALTAVDSAEALGSDFAPFHRGFVHWWAGDVEEAGAAYSVIDLSTTRPRMDQSIPMAHALFAVGDSTEARRIVEQHRDVIEAWVLADYAPEQRVFPQLQLAAIDGDIEEAVALFQTYVERGGRDYRWFERSPLFAELREVPAFQRELEELRTMVEAMRRQMERELPTEP
ncbi:MAG: tetratricopeptide repeat protein, partial [Longimicrobiales bacterium]|nr:tetratricopeptide repeat protein [Longimicrobiales bacterium]